MSLAQLKDEAAQLQSKEQRELIAFLIAQQTSRDDAFKKSLASKIDDRDPAHWVELDDVRKREAD
jgi:hypothetical protein